MKLVLDTNVVIDWLVFDHAFLASFREQVRSRGVQVITHRPALVELERVLEYPVLKLSAHRRAAVLEQYGALASYFESGAELPAGFPRCRDPDDNPFLQLAWQAGADALVSRDKAVLKLAKRARKFGFQIYDVPRMVAVLGERATTEVLR
ncbi:MAG: putative toxin-antitoxin system toxin component, PIN family [Gammaproteobacteria bacterium]